MRSTMVPESAFLDIARIELPLLVGVVEARKQPLLLFFLRDVEEEFDGDGSVPQQMPFEGVDVFVALVPDILGDELRRQVLFVE